MECDRYYKITASEWASVSPKLLSINEIVLDAAQSLCDCSKVPRLTYPPSAIVAENLNPTAIAAQPSKPA